MAAPRPTTFGQQFPHAPAAVASTHGATAPQHRGAKRPPTLSAAPNPALLHARIPRALRLPLRYAPLTSSRPNLPPASARGHAINQSNVVSPERLTRQVRSYLTRILRARNDGRDGVVQ